MKMNFTVNDELLNLAANEMVSSNNVIDRLKSQFSILKQFPPDYEYKNQVESTINDISTIFKRIDEVSSQFSDFLSSKGLIQGFSLANGYFPILSRNNNFLNLNKSNDKKTMSNLIDYYNLLSKKASLTSEEKKTYDALYTYIKSNDIEKFLNTASAINKHYRDSGVTYSTSQGIYNKMDDSKKSNKTCCATYVAQTLYDYNKDKFSRYNTDNINYNYCQTLYDDLKKDGSFKEINNINDLQPGDIVFMRNINNDYGKGIQHVQIYAGNNEWYNAGSNLSIQKGKYQATDQNYRYVVALRPDFKNNEIPGDDE